MSGIPAEEFFRGLRASGACEQVPSDADRLLLELAAHPEELEVGFARGIGRAR